MAHQQESLHPFSFQQGLSCFLSHMAKGSTSKPCGSNLCLWLPHLGLKPSSNLPLQPHFWLLPQSATPTSIPVFFQLFWAAIVSLAGVAPWRGANHLQALMQALCKQGELPPIYFMGWSHSYLPGSKHSHNYLTYPWNQLSYRYVKWPFLSLVTKPLLCKTALNGLVPCVPSPSSDLWGWGHHIHMCICILYFIFPGHPDTLSSGFHYKSLFGDPLAAPCYTRTPDSAQITPLFLPLKHSQACTFPAGQQTSTYTHPWVTEWQTHHLRKNCYWIYQMVLSQEKMCRVRELDYNEKKQLNCNFSTILWKKSLQPPAFCFISFLMREHLSKFSSTIYKCKLIYELRMGRRVSF